MNWALISSHDKYIAAWKDTTRKNMYELYNKFGHNLVTHLFVCGYNYFKNNYAETISPVHNILATADIEHKMHFYNYVSNIEKYVEYQPLAVCILFHTLLVSSFEEQHGLILMFQNRLFYNREVYTVKMENPSALRGTLHLDHSYSKMDLGPEVEMFEKAFCFVRSMS